MNRIFLMTGALLICCSRILFAQISPGELSNAHKELEGMGNCTACHTVGKALANDNCFTCHGEIESRIRKKQGYHFSSRQQQCVDCHKEHHGRYFDIIRFDKTSFDHRTAGFALEGKHSQLSCEQCHQPKRIVDGDAKKFSDDRKKRTFLGLGKTCLSCHNDIHAGQFKSACTQCHSLTAWKPASRFDHQRARFRLTGAHSRVQCEQCHKKTTDPASAVRFVGLEFGSCRSCHTDPHAGKFKQECSRCHSTESWFAVKAGSFNHSQTKFPLEGKHKNLACEQCHAKDSGRKNVAGENGFRITRFQLCSFCHADAHAGQFRFRNDGGECAACHTVNGFLPAVFDAADHAATRLALTGAHKAVPCIQCHRSELPHAKSSKKFRWEEEIQCLLCHTDVHAGQFKGKMKNGCETCHSTDSWQRTSFEHDKTSFPLRGKHASAPCAQCHKVNGGRVQFVGIQRTCDACHADVHAGQFTERKGTPCERCHSEIGWKTLAFDHNTQSRFALTGKHVSVQCEKCHKAAVINNKRVTKYKPLEAACIDCHPA